MLLSKIQSFRNSILPRPPEVLFFFCRCVNSHLSLWHLRAVWGCIDGSIQTPMPWRAVLRGDMSVTAGLHLTGKLLYFHIILTQKLLHPACWMQVHFFYCKLRPLNNIRFANRAEQRTFLLFFKNTESQAFCLLRVITKAEAAHNRLNLLPWAVVKSIFHPGQVGTFWGVLALSYRSISEVF